MQDLKTAEPAADAGEFALGVMLGSRRAFAAVAGRCSAADAECLRQVRDRKLYLSRAGTWEEFCPQLLGLSKTHALSMIRYLEEFGPDYFDVVQLTRITPEQYRAIAPAVRENNIHVNGQAIAMIPENSDRLAAAVAELRQAAAPSAAPPSSSGQRMAAIERRFDRLVTDFHELAGSPLSDAERNQLDALLSKVLFALERLQ